MKLLRAAKPAAPTVADQTPPFSRQLLHETREELDRADRKAQILFAAASVAVAVVLSGIVSGDWSPLQLPLWALVVWSVGAAFVAVGLILLGASIFPRIVHRDPEGKVAYFGHAASYPSVEALHAALELAAQTQDDRTTDQLWVVSRIVVRKYRLIRWSLTLLGLGFVLVLAASIGGYTWP